MKKTLYSKIIFCLLITSLMSFEQIGTSGAMGSVTIDDKLYNQLSLRPELAYGNLGIGLDIYLYFNDDGIYEGNWDFSSFGKSYKTIIDKIYYLRWGTKKDDLYFRVGALPSITLGYGILVNSYTNTIQYPDVRRIGLNFIKLFKNRYKVNFVYSDFKQATPGLVALRVSSSIRSVPRASWGVTGTIDLNQNKGFLDHDGDQYPDFFDPYPYDSNLWDEAIANKDYWRTVFWEISPNPNEQNFEAWFDTTSYIGHNEYSPSDYSSVDPISGFSLDASYRITKNSYIYAQFAQLFGETKLINDTYDRKLGYGFIPFGFHGKYGMFAFDGEYRIASRNFVFGYWDMSYDLNRVSLSENSPLGLTEIITKESTLYKYGDLKGLYVNISAKLLNLVSFNIAYQNMKGEVWSDVNQSYIQDNNNSLLSLLKLDKPLFNFIESAQVIYKQNNVVNPFNFDPSVSSIYGYDLAIRVSEKMIMLYKRRITFEIDGDGQLVEVPSLQIETQMKF